jgi:glycerol-3-phosphate acyltransferase PlsY
VQICTRSSTGPAPDRGRSATILALTLCISAYLLGSAPFAWLLGRSLGVDIRRHGSGNIGATNLGRVCGRRWAILAFVLDALKGLLPVIAARVVLERVSETSHVSELQRSGIAVATGTFAIVGHVFPIWLRFRGGKGVATAFGAIAGICWPAAAISGAVWLGLSFIWRTVSLASIAAGLAFPIAVLGVEWMRPISDGSPRLAFALGCAVLIIVRHRENIRRLWRGEELSFRRSDPTRANAAAPPASSLTDSAIRGPERNVEEPP